MKHKRPAQFIPGKVYSYSRRALIKSLVNPFSTELSEFMDEYVVMLSDNFYQGRKLVINATSIDGFCVPLLRYATGNRVDYFSMMKNYFEESAEKYNKHLNMNRDEICTFKSCQMHR